MSNRYAIIENGLVVNVVLAEADLASQNGWIECPVAGRGWKHDGSTFIEPDSIPEIEPALAPTKEQLMVELANLTAKIQALA